MTARLSPETFDIPAAETRRGYRSAIYFSRAKQIAAADPYQDGLGVTMQVFQKRDAVLCGMDEAIGILRIGTGRWRDQRAAELLFDEYMQHKLAARGPSRDKRFMHMSQLVKIEDALDEEWISEFDEIEVSALFDGDEIRPWESVMHIVGKYSAFAHLESMYLGVLARRTLVATNTRRVVNAANGKPLLFFADRFDHWSTQGGDGYAARIGGATGFATDAMGAWWGEPGMGTMPHALIAFYEGDTARATQAFAAQYPGTNLIALVDFNNDCATEAIRCAKAADGKLWGVRLDTSENMVDKSISADQMGDFKPTGVNPRLVENVRYRLDAHGFPTVRIIVSGGFDAEKISMFEDMDLPVDSYAVGSSLLRGNGDFTADIVKPVAKAGRRYRPNDRLKVVE